MLRSSFWTKFACALCLIISQVVNGGSSNNRNDNGISGSNSNSASVTSNNLLNGLPSSNINVVAPSSVVGEPKAIGSPNWYHGYGSPYAVVAHQTPLARDSYADSATNLGYGAPVGGEGGYSGGGGGGGGYAGGGGGGGYGGGGGGYDSGQQTTYHYQLYPAHQPSGGYGVHEDDDEGGGGGGGSGAIGLLGLLGLKGLKGVKVIKGLKALGLFAPLLLPLLLPILPILLLPLLLLLLPLLLFLPIPVITVPATGRGFTMLKETARLAHGVATAEECIERISCEAARFARGFGYDAPWVQGFLEKSSSQAKWIERVSRGVKSTECKKYTCEQISAMKKSLKLGKV